MLNPITPGKSKFLWHSKGQVIIIYFHFNSYGFCICFGSCVYTLLEDIFIYHSKTMKTLKFAQTQSFFYDDYISEILLLFFPSYNWINVSLFRQTYKMTEKVESRAYIFNNNWKGFCSLCWKRRLYKIKQLLEQDISGNINIV